MGTTCILGVDDNKVLKDFVRAHVELLAGPKICVSNWYPDFKYAGETIRYFYTSRPVRSKLTKLLPQFAFTRIQKGGAQSQASIDDAYDTFFRKHDVDLILAEFGPAGADITPHARRLGIPLIVHFHGHDAHRKSVVDEFASRYRAMFDYAFRIVSVSRYMTEALVSLGADRSRILYNPYGPRDSFFENEPTYEPVILSVGRFTDIKANYLTLLAFSKALRSCPNARLVMVGDGELLETCRTLSHSLGINESVTFTGAVPHAEVAMWYRNACCFAQHSMSPSYGDAEGTPVAILEAGAAALPVVATNHAGIPDVVDDGATGFLVNEGDVDAMSARMVELLSDAALARRMGTAARTRVRESFSMTRHISSLQAAIDEARTEASRG
jgi:colanic acid/amylovoran biosynthesis glycosyltransferase